MAEYIEREKLGIGRCNPEVFEDKGYAKGWNAAIDIIQSAPAADVRPVVRGKWLHKGITDDFHVVGQCSVCKERRRIDNFCPNCGARMEG